MEDRKEKKKSINDESNNVGKSCKSECHSEVSEIIKFVACLKLGLVYLACWWDNVDYSSARLPCLHHLYLVWLR